MSPPEKLVEVGAKAIRAEMLTLVPSGAWIPQGRCELYAKVAIAAAAAALPKVLGSEPSHSGSQEYRDGWADCLAALAREFGEPT